MMIRAIPGKDDAGGREPEPAGSEAVCRASWPRSNTREQPEAEKIRKRPCRFFTTEGACEWAHVIDESTRGMCWECGRKCRTAVTTGGEVDG